MTQSTNDRVEKIQKLLAKAEAKGTTPEEAAILNEKAAELMAKYMIDDALLASVDRLVQEKIVTRVLSVDVPHTYAHEYVSIGIRVAEGLGAKGLHQSQYVLGKPRRFLFVCGYESDIDKIEQLWRSLVTQCMMRVGPFVRSHTKHWMSGTDKFHMRRGFVLGFGTGVAERLRRVVQEAKDSSESQALVLVDREARVDQWMKQNVEFSLGQPRRYDIGAVGAGYAAGLASDTGQTRIGTARKEIGQ